MASLLAKGIAANSGISEGIVKVVTKTEELPKVELGNILVVKTSNPAWTVGMLKSSALISETGGIISHVAIVAREMGIPCVVAVENATRLFKDGQKVRVNGNTGEIHER